MTGRDKTRYVHLLNRPGGEYIFVPGFTGTVTEATSFDNKQKIRYKQIPEGLFIYLAGLPENSTDAIVELRIR
jgi:alpha-L-fucosidase